MDRQIVGLRAVEEDGLCESEAHPTLWRELAFNFESKTG